MNKILVNVAMLSIFTIAVPANAAPATAWRTRSTSLLSREQCVRRAFDTMEQAGFKDIRASGLNKMAVYAQNEQVNSTVVCENGGALAAIFCSGYNRDETIKSCDYIAASMNQ